MRRKSSKRDDSMTLVLVNEMRRIDEATERMRLVVKAMALRSRIRYEVPRERD